MITNKFCSSTELSLVGEGIVGKPSVKLPPIFNQRSRSFVSELSDYEQIPERRSVLEKRSPQNCSLMANRSSVDAFGHTEDSDNDTIYAVSEVSNASMEQTPIKVSLEPMLLGKNSSKKAKRTKKVPTLQDTKIMRNQSSLMSGTVSSEFRSQTSMKKPAIQQDEELTNRAESPNPRLRIRQAGPVADAGILSVESRPLQPVIRVDQISSRPRNEEICNFSDSLNLEQATEVASSSKNLLSITAIANANKSRVGSSYSTGNQQSCQLSTGSVRSQSTRNCRLTNCKSNQRTPFAKLMLANINSNLLKDK